MILLFWRYRRAMDQLSDKMRECHEKEAAEKLAEAQNQQTEGITAIYRKPDAPEPEEVPETETEETPETKKRSLNPNRLRRTDAFAVRFLTHKRNICCPVR